MKSDYFERKERLIGLYQDRAKKLQNESEATRRTADHISNMIPFGQPILVGHHSEKHARKDFERIHNGMRKSIDLQTKSEYYANKADNAENNTAISSDNPEAIQLLENKLSGLIKERDWKRAYNKQVKKEQSGCPLIGEYVFANLSGNISSTKKRIAFLKSVEKVKDESIIGMNGIRLEIVKDDNRVKLFFPGIPSEETRTKLKQNGFHWSPYNSCWQRMINNWSIAIARGFLND